MKILMVCLGNICRSPLADGLLRKKVSDAGLSVQVDSAGTSAYHIGNQPDERTQANAKKHGLDLSFLSARQFKTADFDAFDQIYVMDESNETNVLNLARNDQDANKVERILNLLPSVENKNVPDPYFGGDQGFEHVYQLLDQATDKIIEQLQTSTKS